MDITATGCYVLVGCGNGYILLFDMSQPSQKGLLVGHIQAKGLHTNLLMTLKITEDCRYCFAGVMRGSSEMLAIDLGRLPVWESGVGVVKTRPITNNKYLLSDLVSTLSHSDAKLRGFGAAVKVGNKSIYRLVCGKGIKNVHIWQFTPPSADYVEGSPNSKGKAAQWTCMYDVASNGNTIECLGFRDNGMKVISKSAAANVRIWDISQYDKDPTAKITYEDIPNSNDIRSLSDTYAFGGTYDFAVINLDAPKTANRDSYEIPSRSNYEVNDDSGQRRKRMMRQIDSVIGTNDAKHVLALCTDGGVLYFKYNNTVEGAKVTANDFSLIEFQSLNRNPGVDSVWIVKRVGYSGDVVILRALDGKLSVDGVDNTKNNGFASIKVDLLSDVAPDEVSRTNLPGTDDIEAHPVVVGGINNWNQHGYYYDPSDPPNKTKTIKLERVNSSTAISQERVSSSSSKKGEPMTKPPLGSSKKKSENDYEKSATKEPKAPKSLSSATKTPLDRIHGSNVRDTTISPADRLANPTGSGVKRPREKDTEVVTQTEYRATTEKVNKVEIVKQVYPVFGEIILPPLPKRKIILSSEPPHQSKYYNIETPAPKVVNQGADAASGKTDFIHDWYNTCKSAAGTDIFNKCSVAPQFGISGIQQIGSILLQQDKLRNSFLNDVLQLYKSKGDNDSFTSNVDKLVNSYRCTVYSMLARQVADLKGAVAMDNIFDAAINTQEAIPSVVFKHESMFSSALKLVADSM